MAIPDSSGGSQVLTVPGQLVLSLMGREVTLLPVRDGPDDSSLLLIFRDATAGRETYGAGRFVRAEREAGGAGYIVDFNQAYTPPCGFTPYATCPLPPATNRLRFPIRAGERTPPASTPAQAPVR